MTWVFLSVPRYDWCAPLSHPSSCMLVNHGPSQQSSKEENKPWKWGATARYYTSHTKTMLPTRKSGPRSSRRSDYEDLLTIVKRRKLQWSCLPFIRSSQNHLARHSERGKKTGLAKTILQGGVKGGRRQGRQRKRWEDNFREWTGLGFGKSQRALENGGKWRELVAKSSVVPQRPSRLRDRWWWWWWWWWSLCYCAVKKWAINLGAHVPLMYRCSIVPLEVYGTAVPDSCCTQVWVRDHWHVEVNQLAPDSRPQWTGSHLPRAPDPLSISGTGVAVEQHIQLRWEQTGFDFTVRIVSCVW